MEEAYRQARKRGEQGRRRAISQSEHPYLTDLDSLIAQLPLGQRESVGLRDIPLEMVIGTVTKGRQSAFSCNFMPLLPFNTEFARKWSNLYDIQVTEGYRDPIIVTEFMHRFYVQEGNKRVSVLKFLDAPTVSAKVTRLYPGTWDSVESRLYGEFCSFWRVCPPIRDRVLARGKLRDARQDARSEPCRKVATEKGRLPAPHLLAL